MTAPLAEIDGCRVAHRRLGLALDAITDLDARRASRLPQWTVGHVLTHLARNAEAMVRRIEAAAEDRTVEQYAGGPDGRAAEIEAGASRPIEAIIADVGAWSARLDEFFGSLPSDVWSRPVRTVAGGEHPVSRLPFRRWREVEVHHVDLDIGFEPSDWSPGLVERALPRLLDGISDRTSNADLMAWMLGRGEPPDLEPWA